MKFKIGDHVRIIKRESLAEGVIKHVSEYPPEYTVDVYGCEIYCTEDELDINGDNV